MPTREELAYVAGLFDGEGCVNFTVAGKQRYWVIRVMIRNTDRDLIQYLQSMFGGRIETAKHAKRPHWKPSYCWRLDWDAAIEFLCAIEPWVRLKSDQILVAKFWYSLRNRRGQRVDAEKKEAIGLLVRQLQWLNRKGVRAANDTEPMAEVMKEMGYAS